MLEQNHSKNTKDIHIQYKNEQKGNKYAKTLKETSHKYRNTIFITLPISEQSKQSQQPKSRKSTQRTTCTIHQ